MDWPHTREELIAVQEELAAANPVPWRPEGKALAIGGCFVCFVRGPAGPGRPGDRAWAGAAVAIPGLQVETIVIEGAAGASYTAGLLALHEGHLLEAAVRGLSHRPTCCWWTPPAGTILVGPAWLCTWARSSTSRPSASLTARFSRSVNGHIGTVEPPHP